MSDSYGTNYLEYVDGESSGVRNSKAETYEKGVFRSGNYGAIGSHEMGSFAGNSANSVAGGGFRGTQGSGAIVSTSGAIVNTSGTGHSTSTNYVQQRSNNYLSESRGSGISGVSGLSRGEMSSKSSRAGGISYNYQ